MRLLLAIALAAAGAVPAELLRPVGALPAHIAGRFGDLATCQQTPDGEYFVLDRRAHAVFGIPPGGEPRELVQIGSEGGRVLRPYAFHLGGDGSFVVADAPGNQGRVQLFLTSGASVGRFRLDTREVPLIVFDGVVLSGIGALDYDGRRVLVNQPEMGALVTEYDTGGLILRTFGPLRRTGHEADRAVHLALNAGIPLIDPHGGYYFVFMAGTPMFRKYDAGGRLLFERHIEGPEIDPYVQALPTAWPRRTLDDGAVFPLVTPGVRTAAVDRAGNLWVSLVAPYTYVYDQIGEKRRTVQFRGAGILSPRDFFFTGDGRVLVAPGCYAFAAAAPANGVAPARNDAAPGSTR